MSKNTKVSALAEFDAAPYLDSEEAIAAYLTDTLEAGDPALLAAALGDMARARGMTEVAKASGLAREALYPCTPEQAASACGLLRGVFDRIPNTISQSHQHPMFHI